MRLIDADEIRIKPDFILYGVCGTPVIRCEDLARIINDMPTIDPQPEIIGCKDCKHSDEKPISDGRYLCLRHGYYMYYCSDAERKEE